MKRFSVKRGAHGDTDYLEMVEDADGPYCLVGDAASEVREKDELIQKLANLAETWLAVTMAPSQRREFMANEFGLRKVGGTWEKVNG